MPVIASISRSPQLASRSFSQADARSPWKTKPSFLILPPGVHSMTCAQTPRKRSGVYGSPFPPCSLSPSTNVHYLFNYNRMPAREQGWLFRLEMWHDHDTHVVELIALLTDHAVRVLPSRKLSVGDPANPSYFVRSPGCWRTAEVYEQDAKLHRR